MPSPRTPRRGLRILAGAAVLLGGGLLLDVLFDAYDVPTGSMEPLLHGDRSTGDRVLVLRAGNTGRSLRRFDLAVFRSPDGAHCVKRLVGLPDESVQVIDGDLYVGRALHRKDDAAREACAVPLFDSRRSAIEGFWETASGRWDRGTGGWILEAPTPGLLRNRAPILDGYLDPDGRSVAGSVPVRDLSLEANWTPLGEGGELRIEIREAGDLFAFRLERKAKGALASLARMSGGREEALARGEVGAGPGPSLRLEASNVDNRLRFRVDGRDAFPPVDYDRNTPRAPRGATLDPEEGASGVTLGGAGLRARLDRILLRRDLHYVPRGRFGVERPVELGPDQYFFLGDNAVESLDCREWGPVEGGALLGRPFLIYWPPRRMRWL